MFLCFSAGGINGLVHVGAWRVLETISMKQGTWLHTQIEGASGASVGSIIALAVVLGYSSVEFEHLAKDALTTTNIQQAHRDQQKGLLSISVIANVVKDMLQTKTGHADITFGELYTRGYAATGKRLVMSVHNLTTLKGEMFGTHLTDDCEVWRAVCMSCSLPIVFGSMMYKDCEYTDGGLSNALPLEEAYLERTIAIRIVKTANAFGCHESLLSHLGRIIEAYGTATEVRLETQRDRLLSFIEVVVDTPTMFKLVTTGGSLTLQPAEQRHQIHIGMMAALKVLYPDLAMLISTLYHSLGNLPCISAECLPAADASVPWSMMTPTNPP